MAIESDTVLKSK